MAQDSAQPPRGLYLSVMTGLALVGALAAAGMALALDGTPNTLLLSGATVLIASMATLFPGVLSLPGGAQTWGLLVLGASVARMLVILGIGAYLDETKDVTRQAFWLGTIVGAAVVLAGETFLAVKILSRLERERLALRGRDPDGRVNA